MTKLAKLARALLFVVMTFCLVAATAWGSVPPVRQCRTATFLLHNEINEGVAANLQEVIRLAKLTGITELVIDVDSPGGDAVEGLKLYQVIKTAGIHTTCRAGDFVASAAFLAFQACDLRLVAADSTLLTHRVYSVVRSPIITPELATRIATDLAAIAATMDGYIASRLGLTMAQYLEKVGNGHDWEMTSDQAIAAHAADAIIPASTPPTS